MILTLIMSDKQIWGKFKSGDREAFSQIFHEHIKVLYTYGNKFTRDTQLVEDSVQDLFFEIWQKRENLGETDSIRRYLLGSLRRKIIRQDQRAKKYISDQVEMDTYDFQVEFTFETLLIEKEISEENQQKISLALNKLSKRQKEAIYLKFYAEMDYQQIAKIMQLNYQSVRNLVHTSLKKLRQILAMVIILLLSILGF